MERKRVEQRSARSLSFIFRRQESRVNSVRRSRRGAYWRLLIKFGPSSIERDGEEGQAQSCVRVESYTSSDDDDGGDSDDNDNDNDFTSRQEIEKERER